MRCNIMPLIFILLWLTACQVQTGGVNEQMAADAAWNALDPLTTSHNRSNFQVVEARLIKGNEVSQRFKDNRTNSYCWGARVPPNPTTFAAPTYWYVVLRRRPMTEPPVTRVSPTQPPAIPDWHIYEAYFLIDATTGQVVARSVPCVVI